MLHSIMPGISSCLHRRIVTLVLSLVKMRTPFGFKKLTPNYYLNIIAYKKQAYHPFISLTRDTE